MRNSLIPNFGSHLSHINGKPTATAILTEYWPEISKNWNDATAGSYIDYFNDVILKHFSTRPIAEFDSLAKYEAIIANIKKSGTRRDGEDAEYSEATLQKFRFLISQVLKTAAEKGVCTNVLWGTSFSVPEDSDTDKEDEEVRTEHHKSLLPYEELKLDAEVFQNPLQSGEATFSLLAWALGGRPQELAAVLWSDIKAIGPDTSSVTEADNTTCTVEDTPAEGNDSNPAGDDANQRFPVVHPDGMQYAIALLTTVYKKGYKVGGKTPSMFRYIPISPRLYQFLLKRREAVEKAFIEQKAKGTLPIHITSVDMLPVCCAGDNYFARCNLQTARNYCRDLLRRIGIKEAIFRFYEREAARSKDKSVWGEEKSVTTYLLRRNFCTHLYNLGLSEEEIHYLLGHSMKHMVKKRSDFRYTPFMQDICDKLAKRPIFNPPPQYDGPVFNSVSTRTTRTERNVPQQNIRVGCHPAGGKLEIKITPNEAGDPIRIDFEVLSKDGNPVVISGEYASTEAHGDQRQNVNVLSDLLRIYKTSTSRYNSQNRIKEDAPEKEQEGGDEE